MKMMLLMCEETIADDVREILVDFCGHGCFLEIQKAHASIGPERRMDSAAFPGTANLFLAPLPEEQIAQVKERLLYLETSCPYKCCLKMMALEAQEVL